MRLNIYNLFFTALIFTGCSLSPNLEIPQTDFPLQYENSTNENSTINKEWWKTYEDEKLTSLIDEALKNNYDMRTAMVNISLSRAA